MQNLLQSIDKESGAPPGGPGLQLSSCHCGLLSAEFHIVQAGCSLGALPAGRPDALDEDVYIFVLYSPCDSERESL